VRMQHNQHTIMQQPQQRKQATQQPGTLPHTLFTACIVLVEDFTHAKSHAAQTTPTANPQPATPCYECITSPALHYPRHLHDLPNTLDRCHEINQPLHVCSIT
jgi:hypothetical protein